MKALVNGGDWKMALKLFEAWGPYCSSKKGYRLIKFCCGLEMCNMYIYILCICYKMLRLLVA